MIEELNQLLITNFSFVGNYFIWFALAVVGYMWYRDTMSDNWTHGVDPVKVAEYKASRAGESNALLLSAILFAFFAIATTVTILTIM